MKATSMLTTAADSSVEELTPNRIPSVDELASIHAGPAYAIHDWTVVGWRVVDFRVNILSNMVACRPMSCFRAKWKIPHRLGRGSKLSNWVVQIGPKVRWYVIAATLKSSRLRLYPTSTHFQLLLNEGESEAWLLSLAKMSETRMWKYLGAITSSRCKEGLDKIGNWAHSLCNVSPLLNDYGLGCGDIGSRMYPVFMSLLLCLSD